MLILSQQIEVFFIWALRFTSCFSLLSNLIFYLCLFCRYFRFNLNIHWYLCNFAISELLRNVAVLAHGFLWEKQIQATKNEFSTIGMTYPNFDYNKTIENATIIGNLEQVSWSFLHILYAKDVVVTVLDICQMTTCLFGYLTLIQFHFMIKFLLFNSNAEILLLKNKFYAKNFFLGILIWFCGIFYVIIMAHFCINQYESDDPLIGEEISMTAVDFENAISICFGGISLIGVACLFYGIYKLYGKPIDDPNLFLSTNDVWLFEQICKFRRQSCRYLLRLTLALAVPVLSILFASWANFCPYLLRNQAILAVFHHCSTIYLSILSVAWILVWYQIDLHLRDEKPTMYSINDENFIGKQTEDTDVVGHADEKHTQRVVKIDDQRDSEEALLQYLEQY
uniref:Uncharacterized protein n=1 Tax=Romanomermis culicivorax TaxID=13658 RepID=A0A915K5V6_ROMCU